MAVVVAAAAAAVVVGVVVDVGVGVAVVCMVVVVVVTHLWSLTLAPSLTQRRVASCRVTTIPRRALVVLERILQKVGLVPCIMLGLDRLHHHRSIDRTHACMHA